MSTTVKYVERTDIKLETQADCYKVLLNGLLLRGKGNLIKLLGGFVFNVTEGRQDANWYFNSPTDWEVFEEQQIPWYETATFPVLCWVDKDRDYPTLITGYEVKENGLVGFISKHATWYDCVPVTKEQFEQYNGQFNSSK